MPNNEKQWSSAEPGLLIIMIDQSGSMRSPYNGNSTRTEFASQAINHVIDEIIQKNYNGDKPKNRCFISVIGYNHNISEIKSGWLDDFDANPLRIKTVKKKIADGAGGLVEIDYEMPIWVEPIQKDGATNMKGAFEVAKELCSKWMSDNVDCPAPVIINISDGRPYYDRKDFQVCMDETIQVAKEIMSLSNSDGNVLIFNAEIGDEGSSVVFPKEEVAVASRGEGARFLFQITSVVPQGYADAAKKNNLPLVEGARGCIFAAKAEELIGLIDFGSTKGHADLH